MSKLNLASNLFKCTTHGARQFLWTAEIHQRFLDAGAVYPNEQSKVLVKYFCPWGKWTWYIMGINMVTADDFILFGYVVGQCNELGSVSLKSLHDFPTRCYLGIERDIHFEPAELAVVKVTEGLE